MVAAPHREPARFVGRYAIYDEIAAGGMATVHFGRLFATAGFSRSVAIKRLHPQFAKDPEFVAMFLDEAHVAARIRHPNVVPTLDVVAMDGELFIVMEYVQGETLARLVRPADRSALAAFPPRVAAAILSGVLHGLHAAHEATNDAGEPLGIVHRDVSPQNILVGVDGVTRVLDFGIAKARDCIHITRGGLVKGKIAYMAPEQLVGGSVDRRADVYAAGVLLWETLVGRRLFHADGEFATADKVKANEVEPPSRHVRGLPLAYDEVVLRAVSKNPDDRFPTAREMAAELEGCAGIATPSEVGAWVEARARDALDLRSRVMTDIERRSQKRVRTADATAAGVEAPTRVRGDPTDAPTVEVDPEGVAPTRALEHVVQLPASGTQLSMERAGVAEKRAGRRWIWVAGGAGAAAVAAMACVVVMARGHGSVSPSATATSGSAGATPDLAAAIPQVAVDDLPVASASASTSTSTSTPAPVRPAPRRSCNPPYVVDARGVRHLKPECL
jgi:hypothetical protein